MKREIKFRGKRLDNGQWISGGISIFQDEATILDYDDLCNSAWDVKMETVGQFKGLHDKNGKEIYEGDIIKWKETRFHTEEQQKNNVPMPKLYKSVVVWEEGGFVVSGNQENDTPICCFFNDSLDNKFDFKAEIIGNIHENPELL